MKLWIKVTQSSITSIIPSTISSLKMHCIWQIWMMMCCAPHTILQTCWNRIWIFISLALLIFIILEYNLFPSRVDLLINKSNTKTWNKNMSSLCACAFYVLYYILIDNFCADKWRLVIFIQLYWCSWILIEIFLYVFRALIIILIN